MRLWLLCAILACWPMVGAVNYSPSSLLQLRVPEGISYTFPLQVGESATVVWTKWQAPGEQPPCLSEHTCCFVHHILHFNITRLNDSGLYTAMMTDGPYSQVYFFNLTVYRSPEVVRVEKFEFFSLGPVFPSLPFTYSRLAGSSRTTVMSCAHHPTPSHPHRVHCHIPQNRCFYRKGSDLQLEMLAVDNCDGLYLFQNANFTREYKVVIYLTVNKTERASLGQVFFMSVDETQGSYPYTWSKDGQTVCTGWARDNFSCTPSICDYDRFDHYSLWGTMSRQCAGTYIFNSSNEVVTVSLVLQVDTYKSLTVEEGNKVVLGENELEKRDFEWFFGSRRVATCNSKGRCEWAEPYDVGVGATLEFTAVPSLAGNYTLNYNDSELVAHYEVRYKYPRPQPAPKSLLFANVFKSFRHGPQGSSLTLTPPYTPSGVVLWYYYVGGFAFAKIAYAKPHLPVILYRDHFDLKGDRLVIKHLSDLTSGTYLAVSEEHKNLKYQLKIFTVTTTGAKEMDARGRRTQLAARLQTEMPTNDSFGLYANSERGLADFLQYCHVVDCQSHAPPGKNLILSNLYGPKRLVGYYFVKKANGHSVRRHLLSVPLEGSGTGPDDEDYDIYISDPYRAPSPADFVISYFLFFSVALFWVLLLWVVGRTLFLYCKRRKHFIPEELHLMK